MITVHELVARTMELPHEEVNDETGAATTEAWTSMRHVQLVVAIEKTYGVRLSPRDARSVRSVADVRRVLATYGVQS